MAERKVSLQDVLRRGRSLAAYWFEWSVESNAWREAARDGDLWLEAATLVFLASFLALHQVMLQLQRRGYLGEVLASRPTLIANQVHCTTVSCLALWLLVTGETLEDFGPWQRFGIPISLAYFLADIYWYCAPKRDALMLLHHATMLCCHYPVGSTAGAHLCGAGNALFAVRLSMLGYLCELSNPLMNYRWWLLQTLRRNRPDFFAVNALLLLSFLGRILLLGFLIFRVLLPRAAVFIEAKQVFIFTICLLGHAAILLLSVYWLRVLTRGGLRGLLVFQPRAATQKNTVPGFTFGADMGRAMSRPKAN